MERGTSPGLMGTFTVVSISMAGGMGWVICSMGMVMCIGGPGGMDNIMGRDNTSGGHYSYSFCFILYSILQSLCGQQKSLKASIPLLYHTS